MRHWWEWPLLLLAILLFLAQLLIASPQKSAAFDEQYHLSAGYSYLRTGDFRLATTHPPLMGMIAALPLLRWENIALPLEDPAWQAGDRFRYSDVFLWEANSNPQGMLVAARQPIMLVGVLLVLGIFWWARRMIGAAASWLVLALALFDPNLLGNARVVTTDLGLTCFLLLALWRLWCWLEDRTGRTLILVGICAGLAACAKYTGLFVGPALLLIVLIYPQRFQGDHVVRRLPALVGMGLTALAVIWALYRFDFGPMPNGPLHFSIPAPFYWQQLYNTFFRIVDLQGARYDFFWGEANNTGWWYYFPVVLALKTPLPLLLLSATGLVLAVRRDGWRRTSVLWVLPLLFLALGLSGVLTIGYRHILPVVPFLILSAGYTAQAIEWRVWWGSSRRRLAPIALILLVGWHIGGSLRRFPHQEAFFNELAGDWYNWSNLLVDSNLDWGQDLPALRSKMDELGIATVNLAYFGKAVPEVYGVRYRPLYSYLRFVDGIELAAYNPYTPEPGWYAISATSLRLGLHQADTVNLYAFFRDRTPDARAGYSIYLYHVTYPETEDVVRPLVVGEPVYHLTPDALGLRPGQRPGQRAQVKWIQTPEIAIYPLGAGFAPPADASYHAVDADFGGVLWLIGYAQATPAATGTALPVTLYWRVGSEPMPMDAPTRGAPLSAFVHLTLPGDPQAKLAQFDGWSVALRGLESGDVIAQPVTLDIPADAAPGDYDLLVGLYSPQTFVRLRVVNRTDEPDAMYAGEVVVQP